MVLAEPCFLLLLEEILLVVGFSYHLARVLLLLVFSLPFATFGFEPIWFAAFIFGLFFCSF